jgi:hypothetical protein
MADSGIFSQDELTADALQPNQEAPQQQDQGADQSRQDERLRDEHGRFATRQEPQQSAESGEHRDEKGNLVPQGALHAEREKRKAESGRADAEAARAADYKRQLDAIAKMREQVQGRQQPQEQQRPAAPADDDIAGQVAYLKAQLERVQGTADGFVRDRQAASLDQAETQHLSAALTTSEAEYRTQKPDYDEAVNHVINARAQELQLYGLNPVQIQQALQQEVLDVTRAAIQQGKSPAEVAYQLAALRGYRPKEGGEQQGGQPPNPAAATLAAITAARQGSRSLGHAAGVAPPKDLNAQTIAAMNDDEFAALYSTPEGRRMIDEL